MRTIYVHLLSLAVFPVFLGCAHNHEARAQHSHHSSAHVAHQHTPSYYVVPVPPELWEGAMSDVPNIQVIDKGKNGLEIRFEVPDDLIGEGRQTMILTGIQTSPGFFSMRGEESTEAQCVQKAQRLNCLINYDKLPMDVSSVTAYLEDKYARNESKLSQKVAVLSRFSGDPVGLLVIDLKTAAR